MKCGIMTLIILGIFDLIFLASMMSMYDWISYALTDSAAVAWLIVWGVGFLMKIVHYFKLGKWACQTDNIENRKSLISGMNVGIYYSLWVAIALPVAMLAMDGPDGFVVSLEYIVSMLINVALFFWWRSSCVDFYREKVKVEHNGDFPKEFENY